MTQIDKTYKLHQRRGPMHITFIIPLIIGIIVFMSIHCFPQTPFSTSSFTVHSKALNTWPCPHLRGTDWTDVSHNLPLIASI